MVYESTKEAAARIRAQLKREKGWNARDVSIRVEYFSMGSSITATVRSARVVTHELQDILETGEKIDRCQVTGNRYVDIRHTPEVVEILARRHSDALERALDKLEAGDDANVLFPIDGTEPPALIGWDQGHRGWGVRLWIDHAEQAYNLSAVGTPYRASCVQGIAFGLALLLERKRAELEVKP